MSKRGSGSSAKLRNGMSRLTGLPETVAKAKEIREIANQAFDKSIDQLKRTEKFFGKQVTKDAIERQEAVRKVINHADAHELVTTLSSVIKNPKEAKSYIDEVMRSVPASQNTKNLAKRMEDAYWETGRMQRERKKAKYSDRIGQILAKAEQNCILMDQITNQNNHEI